MDMGRVHTRVGCSGLVGLIWSCLDFSLLSGSGRVITWACVGHVNDAECNVKFSELLVLLMFEFRCTLCLLYRKSKFQLVYKFLKLLPYFLYILNIHE